MQYLLSEDEMATIRSERLAIATKLGGNLDRHIEGLGNVCKHVASTMITTVSINGRGEGATAPHGCIYVPEPRGSRYRTNYCDGCHVSGICPLPKEYSK